MMPILTPEQLLLIADEFCQTHRVTVRHFDALVGAAAVSGARIDGIPVHASPAAAGDSLSKTIALLEPLSGKNREFGQLCQAIYRRLTE